MAKENLEILIQTNADQAKNGINNFSNSLSSMAKNIIGVGSLILTLKKEIDFLKDSVNLFTKDFLELKKSEAIIKATGQSAGITARQVSDLANEMQDLTGISNTTYISAQNLLLTFKSISGEIYNRTVKVIGDMAVLFGSAESASIQLGKALEDPKIGLTALRRVGVSFSDSQKEIIYNMVDTNRIAEAQAEILSVLESQFGGVAKASRDSIAVMKNDFDDFKKLIGSSLKPTFDAFAETMSKIVKDIEKTFGFINAQGQILSEFDKTSQRYFETYKKKSKEQSLEALLSTKKQVDYYNNLSQKFTEYNNLLKKNKEKYLNQQELKEMAVYEKEFQKLFGTLDPELIKIQISSAQSSVSAMLAGISKAIGEFNQDENKWINIKSNIKETIAFLEENNPEIKAKIKLDEQLIEDEEFGAIGISFTSKEDIENLKEMIDYGKTLKEVSDDITNVWVSGLTSGISEASNLIAQGRFEWESWKDVAVRSIQQVIAELIKMQLLFSIGRLFGLPMGGANVLGAIMGGGSPALGGTIANATNSAVGGVSPNINLDVSLNPNKIFSATDDRLVVTKIRKSENSTNRVSL